MAMHDLLPTLSSSRSPW